jgi:hypothetical protein
MGGERSDVILLQRSVDMDVVLLADESERHNGIAAQMVPVEPIRGHTKRADDR